MNSKVLIIVGMHRSGTSVVTQWLHRCGLFVGNNLVGPGIGNVQGHFEDADFLRLHQKFLRKRNFPESGFVYKKSIELSELEKMELTGLIASKSRKHEEWGWKEPRTSLFLDGYTELIPAAFYVIVVRDFNATINSLVTRQFKMEQKKIREKKGLSRLKWILFKRKSLDKMFIRETNRYLKIWIHYYEKILQHIQSVPIDRFIIVNYAQLNSNDEDFFSKLKNDWQFSLNYSPFKKLYEQELLSEVRDVKKYIKNKELEKKAMAIEEHIRCYTPLSATMEGCQPL
jgi:hypothetical protein